MTSRQVLSWAAVAALALVARPLAAQQKDALKGEIALTRQEIQTGRQEIVRAALPLGEAEAQKFWPLYREYKEEQARTADKSWTALEEFAKGYDTLDEVTAKSVTDNWLSSREAQAKLAKKWRGKFAKAIGEKNTLRFYQIESKLDHMIQGEINQAIPLAK
jgi:hypothetical protein